jgi:clan AA aspartic protease
MGYVKVNVQISNSGDIELWRRGLLPFEQVRRMEVPVVVDTGAINLCLAEEHVEALGLNQLRRQKARLADNSELDLAIVGPVDVAYGDRETTVRALTLPRGSENLLGVIPLEDMDLHPVPAAGTLEPNDPKHTLRRILSPRF